MNGWGSFAREVGIKGKKTIKKQEITRQVNWRTQELNHGNVDWESVMEKSMDGKTKLSRTTDYLP